MNTSVLTNSRIEFEGHLNAYKNCTNEELMALRPRFTGDQWKLNKASLQRANLCPFALKEAFLKALDYRGINRPDCGRFVEESEAYTEAAFWKTPANPVTMTKIHDNYDWIEDEKNTVNYNYQF